MLIIPAIDLRDGLVVRLVQGERDQRVYSRDALKTARDWVSQGAGLIHLVDLNGAIQGVPKNLKIVKQIAQNIDIPVQFGGGLRSIGMIRKVLGFGVRRVVLGTRAIQDQAFLEKVSREFRGKVIVSIDVKNDILMTKGWKSSGRRIRTSEFAASLENNGFREVIYTDISKDGTLKGPSIRELKKLLKISTMKVIASGGVSCLQDLRRLKVLEKEGLTGVIVGKALYEGKFTLSAALKIGGTKKGEGVCI
ncbi:MAG: 1-(5-phosphoribosyl)-5-[(5-phosphoribosylamino)methylideneamino]imidazole-4-carboxamide isomerase [Candidatus Omnitrophica bacterium]|nr:1-(5-phosphoribosyl)-5-[(5-phosphoribosylamino)methylideneamino]imidazole-4-carboxamide isomerase [Candidatus Omnitrophota bacterium]